MIDSFDNSLVQNNKKENSMRKIKKKMVVIFTTALTVMSASISAIALEEKSFLDINSAIEEAEATFDEYATEREASEYWADQEWIDLTIKDINDIEFAGPISARYSIQKRASGQWIQVSDGRWWYKHSDGSYTTNGWELINGEWYYFDEEGWMVTGWIDDAGERYYCNSSGVMQTGWKTISGATYYFNISGAMQTDWIRIDGSYYYLGTDGKKQTNTGVKMIAEALEYQGNPYIYGGTSLTNGTDCSGFTMLIHQKFGMSLLHSANRQYLNSKKVSRNSLKPGDLVFYTSGGTEADHVAFYVGTIHNVSIDGGREYDVYENCIVHARNSKYGIVVSDISFWNSLYGYGTFWR